MQFGDMSGKGRVYDNAGDPILVKAEYIKAKALLRFAVYRSLLSSRPFLLDLYAGTVYLTDRRLLGIRRPDPKKAALARLSYTADMDVLETADKAKMVLAKGGFEFFSLEFEEILRVRKVRLARAVDIVAPEPGTGKEVHVSISPEKRFGKLFGEGFYELWLDRHRGQN